MEKEINDQLVSRIVNDEYKTAYNNRVEGNEEFEEFMDLLNSERQEKDYDWMSDIRIPEFASHVLTQASLDVDQYFSTRDFVEVYLEDEGDEAKANAAAAKELINRTLNQKKLYHYSKFIRAKTLNNIAGYVYAICEWRRETIPVIVDTLDQIDEDGEFFEEDIMGETVTVDRFNYEVLDPRNVFTDNKYVYSLQEKDFVIVRSEATVGELKADAEKMGYINLDLLKEVTPAAETDTSEETYNKEKQFQKTNAPVSGPLDILQRFGKYWCKVTERDETTGRPTKVEPGINKDGNPLEDAELLEVIITFAMSKGLEVTIRFQLQPYTDAEGNPYRPVIRGQCYVHPSEDGGVGDGKYSKELQIAIDDSFNIGQDRVMLATLPTMKGKQSSIEDNTEIRFEPMHVIGLENVDDLAEFKLDDNIQGTLNQISTLANSMDKVTSIFPSTMGALPGFASTTATAVAGAEQRTNIRTNYKSLTFEHTFLTELYWMIQQMTFKFAQPETAEKLMGDKVFDFDPSKDYYYKPVSASIETEQSKAAKVQKWTQILGPVTQLQHPDTVKIVNYILTQMFTYMGDEFVNFGNQLLNPQEPIQPGGVGSQPAGQGEVPSNQFGVPQSAGETQAREAVGGEL
jgi:hypothetical protein